MMTRDQKINALLACDDIVASRDKLSQATDDDLDSYCRLFLRHTDNRISRMDGGDYQSGAGHEDAELAGLMQYFDSALDFTEDYVHADPWLNGQVAAMNAAQAEQARRRGAR